MLALIELCSAVANLRTVSMPRWRRKNSSRSSVSFVTCCCLCWKDGCFGRSLSSSVSLRPKLHSFSANYLLAESSLAVWSLSLLVGGSVDWILGCCVVCLSRYAEQKTQQRDIKRTLLMEMVGKLIYWQTLGMESSRVVLRLNSQFMRAFGSWMSHESVRQRAPLLLQTDFDSL